MIEFNDDNDPYLFAAVAPGGHRIVAQWMEVTASIADAVSASAESANVAVIVASIRQHSRTPEEIAKVSDAWIWGFFVRMSDSVTAAGKGAG